MDLEAIQNAASRIMDRTGGNNYVAARRVALRAQAEAMNQDSHCWTTPQRGYTNRADWLFSRSIARGMARRVYSQRDRNLIMHPFAIGRIDPLDQPPFHPRPRTYPGIRPAADSAD